MTDASDRLVSALLDPSFLDDPYPAFAEIRSADPVLFVPAFNAWLLTRFDDVRTAFTDDRFRVSYAQHQVNRMGPEATTQPYFEVGREFLVLNDPPSHTQLKKIFREPFTSRRVQELAPLVRELASACIDEFVDAGEVDIVGGYAHRVPIGVMSRLLDIPAEHEEQIVGWIGAFYSALFVTPMSPAELESANAAASEARSFFMDIVRARRAKPGQDFLSDVIRSSDASDTPLTDEQIAINSFLLYFAGHDTQKGQFSMLVNTLDRHRDVLDHLLEDLTRLPDAMPELHRFDATGQFMGRTVTEDVELGNKTIRAGQSLMVSMTAANRDPEVFPNPDAIDLTRDPAPGTALRFMTFGTGRHHCLGAFMAQTNLMIMLSVLLQRLGRFEIDRSRAVRLPTMEVRAFHQLPIRWAA